MEVKQGSDLIYMRQAIKGRGFLKKGDNNVNFDQLDVIGLICFELGLFAHAHCASLIVRSCIVRCENLHCSL